MQQSAALPSTGYVWSAEEISIGIRTLMALKPVSLSSGHKFVLQSVRPVDPWVLKRLPRAEEAKVFAVKFEDTPYLREKAWEPYENKDTSIIAIGLPSLGQNEMTLEGAIRLLKGTKLADFKSVVNMLTNPYWGIDAVQKIDAIINGDWTRVGDVATLAIDPNTESKTDGSNLWLGMFHALHLLVNASGIDVLVGVMAEDLFFKLQRIRMGLEKLGECQDYFGWPSIPFVLRTKNLPQTLRPVYADMILHGQGRHGQLFESWVAIANDLRLGI